MSNFLIFFTLLVSTQGLSIWPKPLQQTDSGELFLIEQSTFRFQTTGPGAESAVLNDALKRYRGIIFLHSIESTTDIVLSGEVTGATIYVESANEDLSLETNQSYVLRISAPTVTITANTVYGALNGLESFSQLVSRSLLVNGTTINDAPRYQFRSTMIDTSRHYYTLEVILQHIDAMAYAKFNVLHWHIVDSVSFPYQSVQFPEMSATGAYSPDHVYTADDIKQVVEYAKNRGIRVIPEFDTPGHVQAGYMALDPPILTECYDSSGKLVRDGSEPLNPTLNATYTFLRALYQELQV
jgi:hexosaminidase